MVSSQRGDHEVEDAKKIRHLLSFAGLRISREAILDVETDAVVERESVGTAREGGATKIFQSYSVHMARAGLESRGYQGIVLKEFFGAYKKGGISGRMEGRGGLSKRGYYGRVDRWS